MVKSLKMIQISCWEFIKGAGLMVGELAEI
jgi:hypothetical protein